MTKALPVPTRGTAPTLASASRRRMARISHLFNGLGPEFIGTTWPTLLTHAREVDTSAASDETVQKKSLFVPDAFTNPAHVHFALKVTLAAMSCCVLHAGLDWPGIRTSLIAWDASVVQAMTKQDEPNRPAG